MTLTDYLELFLNFSGSIYLMQGINLNSSNKKYLNLFFGLQFIYPIFFRRAMIIIEYY